MKDWSKIVLNFSFILLWIPPNAPIDFNLWSILDKENSLGQTLLIDTMTWIVLKQEEYALKTPYPDELAENASDADQRAYEKHTNVSLDVSFLMLSTMSYDL